MWSPTNQFAAARRRRWGDKVEARLALTGLTQADLDVLVGLEVAAAKKRRVAG